jgi:hypothetical protein
MALTIETGSGAADTEAYADADAYIAWHTAHWGTAPTAAEAAIEAAIRRGVAFLDGLRWVGSRANGRSQALAWPRQDAVDGEGNEIAEAEIPAEVIDAQHALTRAELASPGTLSPDVTLGGQKVLVGVDSLRWEVQKTANTVEAQRATVTAAMDRIAGLLAGGGSATRMVERA